MNQLDHPRPGVERCLCPPGNRLAIQVLAAAPVDDAIAHDAGAVAGCDCDDGGGIGGTGARTWVVRTVERGEHGYPGIYQQRYSRGQGEGLDQEGILAVLSL